MSRTCRPTRSPAGRPRCTGAPHDPARARPLFGDYRPVAPAIAESRPACRLDDRQSRILGHRPADGAAGVPAPTGQVLLPDVPNWSWHEYGMRVGVWRFFDLFRLLAIRPTLSINARVCEDYERVAGAAREAGWEFMGHAYEQMPIHRVDDQKAMIERSLAVIEGFTGEKPVGW